MIKLIEKAVVKGTPVAGVTFSGTIRLTPESEKDEWIKSGLSLELTEEPNEETMSPKK